MPSAVTHSPPSAPPPPADRMLNLLAWVEIYWNQLLMGMALLVVLFGALYLWRHLKSEKEARANTALLELHARPNQPETSPKAADYLKVAEEYSATLVASRARLLAAAALFTDGRYAESMAEFEKVLARESSGPLAAQAAYGVAASLDALDRIDDAIARYQDVLTRYSEESVAGQARLALARIQEERGQADAALRLYDEVLRDREPGPFVQSASSQRDALLRKHPELAGTNAPSATLPSPSVALP